MVPAPRPFATRSSGPTHCRGRRADVHVQRRVRVAMGDNLLKTFNRVTREEIIKGHRAMNQTLLQELTDE